MSRGPCQRADVSARHTVDDVHYKRSQAQSCIVYQIIAASTGFRDTIDIFDNFICYDPDFRMYIFFAGLCALLATTAATGVSAVTQVTNVSKSHPRTTALILSKLIRTSSMTSKGTSRQSHQCQFPTAT